MKNTCPPYVVYPLLKVLLIIIFKVLNWFVSFCFRLVFTSVDFTFCHFLQRYLKKNLVTNFSFSTDSLNRTTPLLNDQNELNLTF